MAFLGLQAGHQNIFSNIDPVLRAETGAPGEEPFNIKVRDRLSQILIKYGFQVQLDDANANSDSNTIGKDFDFYLALHAEGYPPGGNVVAPDPSVDASNTESRRIVDAIKSVYFGDTGIVDNNLVTSNETFYYMWNVLTAKTPCGIIECGDLADPHDSVILSDINRVALGIAHGLCVAFGIEWKGDPDTPPSPPPDPCQQYKDQIAELQKQLNEAKGVTPTPTTSTPIVGLSVTTPEVPKITEDLNKALEQAKQPQENVFTRWMKKILSYILQ